MLYHEDHERREEKMEEKGIGGGFVEKGLILFV